MFINSPKNSSHTTNNASVKKGITGYHYHHFDHTFHSLFHISYHHHHFLHGTLFDTLEKVLILTRGKSADDKLCVVRIFWFPRWKVVRSSFMNKGHEISCMWTKFYNENTDAPNFCFLRWLKVVMAVLCMITIMLWRNNFCRDPVAPPRWPNMELGTDGPAHIPSSSSFGNSKRYYAFQYQESRKLFAMNELHLLKITLQLCLRITFHYALLYSFVKFAW